MRKKTYRITCEWTDSHGNVTDVQLFTPATDIRDAVSEVKKSSEFNDWAITAITLVNGIVLWKGKTQ